MLPPTQKRKSLLGSYEDIMRQLFGRYPRITAVRMLEELRARGFQGGYSVAPCRPFSCQTWLGCTGISQGCRGASATAPCGGT